MLLTPWYRVMVQKEWNEVATTWAGCSGQAGLKNGFLGFDAIYKLPYHHCQGKTGLLQNGWGFLIC